jgi:DNA-binding CsgD family transcriptional regulator
MQSYVRSDDARALLRLMGEARELLGMGECAAQHVLRGIAALTHAPIAISITAAIRPGVGVRMFDMLDCGWGSESDRVRVYQYVQDHAPEHDPLTRAVLESADGLATLTREDAVANADWQASEIRNDVHRSSGIDDALMSLQRIDGLKRVRTIVLKRAWGERPFGERERTLVHLLHAECAWAFEASAEAPRNRPRLSRRERQTLDLLLTGAPEKHVAERLGVSRHTAHDYVKVVYRKLGVTSRAQLMARALQSGRAGER